MTARRRGQEPNSQRASGVTGGKRKRARGLRCGLGINVVEAVMGRTRRHPEARPTWGRVGGLWCPAAEWNAMEAAWARPRSIPSASSPLSRARLFPDRSCDSNQLPQSEGSWVRADRVRIEPGADHSYCRESGAQLEPSARMRSLLAGNARRRRWTRHALGARQLRHRRG